MNEIYSPLPARQERAAQLLAAGQTKTSVARQLDVSRVTITRWAGLPEFQARVDQLLSSAADEAYRILEQSVVDNLTIILNIAQNGGQPGVVGSQLKAAQWAVEQVLKGRHPGQKEDYLTDELNSLSDSDLDDLFNDEETAGSPEPRAVSTDELPGILPLRSEDRPS